MKNKKAMSEIVTTVIMVVLALVAVAVIWQIINNLITDKGAQIGVTQRCLDIKLNVESAVCAASGCNVSVKREAGGEDIVGLKVVLKSPTEGSSNIKDMGNIDELETMFVTITAVEAAMVDITSSDKVEATAYITDESGQLQNCPLPATRNII